MHTITAIAGTLWELGQWFFPLGIAAYAVNTRREVRALQRRVDGRPAESTVPRAVRT